MFTVADARDQKKPGGFGIGDDLIVIRGQATLLTLPSFRRSLI